MNHPYFNLLDSPQPAIPPAPAPGNGDSLPRQAPAAPPPELSYFGTCEDRKPSCSFPLSLFVKYVKDGRWRPQVERCRRTLRKNGKVAYDALRVEIVPAVTLSAMLKHRRKGTTLKQRGAVHSGFIQIDLDAKDHPGLTVEEIRRIVEAAPFVTACFLSLSGDGVKAIALCPADFQTHAGSWHAAAAYFAERGLTLDPATKDACRLSFVSSDPKAFMRADAVELVPLEVPEKTASDGESSGGTEDPEHVHRVLARLAEKIGPHQKRDTWIHIVGSTVDAVGADAAGGIVDEHFPPFEEGHQSACDVAAGLTGTWNSLRKYGVDPVDNVRSMQDLGPLEVTQENSPPSLRERAYALRFDPDKPPPPDEICMVIGDIPIAARGNLTVPQGKSKVGKSAVSSAFLGAAQRGQSHATGDTLCMSWVGDSNGSIVHLDTEQSRADWHGLVCRSVTRSGLAGVSPRLVSLPLVMFTRSERLEILRQTLEFEHHRGGVDLVMIDGVADLCKSPNDEAEALELVSKLHAMAQEFNCATVCVLHENPGTEQGKTRGHLGSELNRKAFANLRIDKDTETSVSTIYGTDMRKRDIPKEQGFCFAWNEAVRMHTFQGREAGLKDVHRKAKALEKSRLEWTTLFESVVIGTNLTCPELTPEQAAEALRDMTGTEKTVKPETMKKRMQRAEILGVLRKAGAGAWTLTPSGQMGQNRDI